MKEYELTVLIHPDLEVDIETPLTMLRELITTNGGKIVKEDIWGKKRLAYKINKEDFAIYTYFDLELPADALIKISNVLNIKDEILRYLLVAVDLKSRKALEEAKTRATTEKTDERK